MKSNNLSELKEYELFIPYTRYAIYQQELLKNRTVYSFSEIHDVKEHGLVIASKTLSTLSINSFCKICFPW